MRQQPVLASYLSSCQGVPLQARSQNLHQVLVLLFRDNNRKSMGVDHGPQDVRRGMYVRSMGGLSGSY